MPPLCLSFELCLYWMCTASLAAWASVGDCRGYNCVILMNEHWPTVWAAGCRGLHSNPPDLLWKLLAAPSAEQLEIKYSYFPNSFKLSSTGKTSEKLALAGLRCLSTRWELTCRCWWRRGWRWKRCTASRPWSWDNHRRWCPESTPHPGTRSRHKFL